MSKEKFVAQLKNLLEDSSIKNGFHYEFKYNENAVEFKVVFDKPRQLIRDV